MKQVIDRNRLTPAPFTNGADLQTDWIDDFISSRFEPYLHYEEWGDSYQELDDSGFSKSPDLYFQACHGTRFHLHVTMYSNTIHIKSLQVSDKASDYGFDMRDVCEHFLSLNDEQIGNGSNYTLYVECFCKNGLITLSFYYLEK